MSLAYAMEDHRTAPSPASALAEVMDRHGVRARFERDAEIYAQGDEVENLYRVTTGVVRTLRVAADGRRQVSGFYGPGDLFGLEPGPDHQFAAEALTLSEVQVVRRSVIRAHGGDAALNRAILEAMSGELQRAQDHILLLGRKGARERVAGFLMQRAGDGRRPTDLPMSRQDMADYLGLTIETVSRTLTQLQGENVVEFPSSRRFRVTRWDALEAMAD